MNHTDNHQKIEPFRKLLDHSLRVFFFNALVVTLKHPLQALFFLRTIFWQIRAGNLRSEWLKKGITVPPMMIFSITNRCNLKCAGCYHQAFFKGSDPEIRMSKVRSIISEASELGISFCVVAGGEPLIRDEIIDIIRKNPKMIFLVFTNGLLLKSQLVAQLNGIRNFVPVISMEGYEEGTDGRRGKGVYQQLLKNIEFLRKSNVFWSVSITVTRNNISSVTESRFISTLMDLGCRLFFFLEYNAVKSGTEHWALTKDQRKELMAARDMLRTRFKALFISVPGDEEEIGGCLAAGRGFIHVSAEGNVEPCPFAPFSDSNLNSKTLKEALQSQFLKEIRESGDHLEQEGGCALWIKKEWLQTIQNQHQPAEVDVE